MWKQKIIPNVNDQTLYVKSGGVTLKDWYGYCLAVGRSAFSIGAYADTAWTAWTSKTSYKRTDTIPSGVYVPIWFSGYGGAGHVAIYKDGHIWSSPITHKPYFDQWDSIAIVEQKYGVKYVGWSEDMNGQRIVQWEDVYTTEKKTSTEVIPYKTVATDDEQLPLGETKVVVKGVNGTRDSVTTITYKNGVKVSDEVSNVSFVAPIDEVIAVGTHVAPETPEELPEELPKESPADIPVEDSVPETPPVNWLKLLIEFIIKLVKGKL